MQSRLLAAGLLCLLVLTAGYSAIDSNTQSETDTPSATTTPTATVPDQTIPPDERLEIIADTNATVTVTQYEYVGAGQPPDSVASDSANWTKVASQQFDSTPGRFRVTEFEPDGRVIVTRDGERVWERWVADYTRFVLRVDDTGDADVVEGAVL